LNEAHICNFCHLKEKGKSSFELTFSMQNFAAAKKPSLYQAIDKIEISWPIQTQLHKFTKSIFFAMEKSISAQNLIPFGN
jgi:hypothetical protein